MTISKADALREELDFIDSQMGLDDECWNCAGEGYVSSCLEEFACVDPESGCDQCTRPCDVCNGPEVRRGRIAQGG